MCLLPFICGRQAIAGVGVVVDPMPLLQLLDVTKISLRVWTHTVQRVPQRFLEAAVECHSLEGREVMKECRETLLEAHGERPGVLTSVPAGPAQVWLRSQGMDGVLFRAAVTA
jgi:hypothetical protein